ncbi:unnamed protein product [Effrenium voratum]|uniref:Ubiquitin-like domain-containing protein n=1 Tax=Effrenium voratum TaxID=2562239 RepID=A0AA36JKR6_9DINO|nr:unnamed protein product [Effrenium voratum]
MALSFRWPFSMFDHSADDGLQNLRDALEKAEEAVSSSSSDTEEERERKEEILEGFRAKLEELEVETQKSFRITVCSAMSGECVASVRLKPSDSVLHLCEAVVKEMGQKVVSHSVLFQNEVLPQHRELREVGLQDGDTVYLARAPVKCLTASHDGTACMWSFEQDSCSSSDPVKLRPGGALKSATVSPCGTMLLTLSTEEGGSGKLWCAQSHHFLHKLQGGCGSASFAPDGQSLVGVDADGVAVIWCARTGRVSQRMFAPNASSQWDTDSDDDTEMSFANFSPCGRYVVTASGFGAQLWDTSGNLLHTLHGHEGSIRCTAFAQNSRFLLTAASDDSARLWDVETGRCLRVLVGHQGALNYCTFSPTGEAAMTASRDGTVKLWEFEDLDLGLGEALRVDCSLTLEAEGGVVSSACFSPEGSRLLIACASATVRLVHIATGQLQLSLEGLHEDWVRSANFSPDGLIIATSSYDGNVGVWSATTGKCLRVLQGHSQAVVSAHLAA